MSRSESPRPLLEMRGISKTFPAVRALDNVSHGVRWKPRDTSLRSRGTVRSDW
ncbi:hypothetical protein [Burkholderia sp. USMB20]|uniref:hypothetical protein n=1 Tax=Burkholderia sp. USMB20 TaxID=1571773 RepID=UPI00187D3ECC|nr:hypothetical protein [Burkholderia sp. USMB20]